MMRRALITAGLLVIALAVAATVTWHAHAAALREAWMATPSYYGVLEHVRTVPAHLQGRREAQRDLQRGCLRVKTWGLPSPSRPIYIELAQQRFGIATCVTAGCVIDPVHEASWIGYNDVMQREIDRRYGKDALEKLYQEAEIVFKQRHPR